MREAIASFAVVLVPEAERHKSHNSENKSDLHLCLKAFIWEIPYKNEKRPFT
jgi:hypothetical protein